MPAGHQPEQARAHAAIRAALARRGALAYCAPRVRVLLAEATSALERAGAADHPLLRTLVERVWPWDAGAPAATPG